MNESNVKQVIVFRKDLLKGEKSIRKGKFAAQCAHASTSAVLSLFNINSNEETTEFNLKTDKNSPFYQWINGNYTKICLSVNNEEELINLYNKIISENPNIPCSLIEDMGLTEFQGVPTITCIGIGPYWNDDINKFTNDLKLL